MPKLKSNSGAAKRFKFTASGKVKHRQPYKNHILTKKPTKRKRHLRGMDVMAHVDVPSIRQQLPYG